MRLARMTIMSKFGQHVSSSEDEALQKALADPAFQSTKGVFVTLTIGKQLRGCIGNLAASSNVLEGVKRNALNAAFNDYRFMPLSQEELPEVTIEISVLTAPLPLKFSGPDDLIAKLRPGVDGVILHLGTASATFLPQVWEQLPKTEEFLGHLCQKAGLSSVAWQLNEIGIETYQVQHFSE